MPKQRVTREMVVEAAFAIARERGMEAVQVKTVAARLACSVQPIYSYCGSMEGLRRCVEERAKAFVRDYVDARRDPAEPFRSAGLAHLTLAAEEPHLYRVFDLRRQEGTTSLEDVYRREASPAHAAWLAERLQLSRERAQALHLHMLLYTMGMGFLLASTVPGIPLEEARRQLEAAYEAFVRQAMEGV